MFTALHVLLATAAMSAPVRRAPAQTADSTLARLFVGGDALEIVLLDDRRLRVAVADSARTLILTVLPRDVRRWSDSVSRILVTRRRVRRFPQQWSATLSEPGIEAGSMTMTRRDSDAGSTWSLFVSDSRFMQTRVILDAGEAKAIRSAFRRAADVAAPPPPRRRRSPQRPSIRRN